MHDPIAMQIFHRRGQLEEQGLDLGRQEWLQHVFLQRFEIVLDKIHYQENAGLEDQPPELG